MLEDLNYRLVAIALVFAAFGLRAYHQRRADRTAGRVPRSVDGTATLVLLILTALPAYLSILLYLVVPALMGWSTIALPGWSRWPGAGLSVAMLPLLWWMFQSLDKNLTATSGTRATQTLITNGPYRWIRHPLYTFGGLFWLGICILCAQWFAALMLSAGLVVLRFRTTREEANLIEKFGDEYRSYMDRTGRFFPRLSRFRVSRA